MTQTGHRHTEMRKVWRTKADKKTKAGKNLDSAIAITKTKISTTT